MPPCSTKFGILSTKGNKKASLFAISIRASFSYLTVIVSTKKASSNYFLGLKTPTDCLPGQQHSGTMPPTFCPQPLACRGLQQTFELISLANGSGLWPAFSRI